MRIRLKLSVPHDMDLITLTQCQFPVSEWIKISLKSYVEDKKLISVPLPEMPKEIRCAKSEINFSLHETRDKDVMDWLNSLRLGQRTGAIKSIFRCSLSAPCLAGHTANVASVIIPSPKKPPSVIPFTTPSVTHSKAENKTSTPSVPAQITAEDEDDFDIFGFNPDR